MTSRIRPMTLSEVRDVVHVHLQAFPGFFLSFLGPGFLRELYRGIVSDPAGIAFVAEQDGRILGFVAGTAEPAGFYSRLLKRRFLPFAFHAAMAALRRPAAAPRLLRALGRSKQAPDRASGRAELMSLAVLSEARGTGSGAKLVDAFVSRVREINGEAVLLTTDAADNDAVNSFYVNRGFRLCRSFTTPEGRQMNEYEKTVREAGGQD